MKQLIRYNLYKKLCVIFLLTAFVNHLNAQTGLNFQGIARTTNNVIIASQDITLKLSIIRGNPTGITEYIEVRKVTTNAQGLFTAVIGDSLTISTLGKFSDIDWKLSPKFLKIEIDPAAGSNFITMGTTQFQYVAYAKFANSVLAENISGIVPVVKGGTGTNSLLNLKSNLELDKVNNTADSSKPISILTQTANYVMAIRNGINAGMSNTERIIMKQGAGIGNYAAMVAAHYSFNGNGWGGYGDWYLPSLYELQLLFKQKLVVGGFTNTTSVWSSTEADDKTAYTIDFFSTAGTVQAEPKNLNPRSVRAIRSF